MGKRKDREAEHTGCHLVGLPRELGVVNKVEGRIEASENSQRGKELKETVPRRKQLAFKC